MPSGRLRIFGIAALLIGVPLALYAASAVCDWRTASQLASRDGDIIALMNIPKGILSPGVSHARI